jgi:hypothetical protein
MEINTDVLGDRKIIHGHTPRRLVELQNQLRGKEHNYSFNIDTGCAYNGEMGYGNLTAIELTKMKIFFTENLDG